MIDHEDNLYFNEYANRVHNGQWHSVNSYKHSQFSTHIKAILGLEFIWRLNTD